MSVVIVQVRLSVKNILQLGCEKLTLTYYKFHNYVLIKQADREKIST